MGIGYMTQGAQTSVLWQPRGVGCSGRWEGGSSGRGHIYTYGWFMLMYGRNQHNIVIILLLKINLKTNYLAYIGV